VDGLSLSWLQVVRKVMMKGFSGQVDGKGSDEKNYAHCVQYGRMKLCDCSMIVVWW
jgi:hypothetical protein